MGNAPQGYGDWGQGGYGYGQDMYGFGAGGYGGMGRYWVDIKLVVKLPEEEVVHLVEVASEEGVVVNNCMST